MQNASQLENAYDTLKESAGSATKEQEAYMDSLEGKINALKESFTAITMQMMNSDFLKGFIDGMTTGVNAVSGFIDTFGAMPTTVTAVVGALAIFNTKFRESVSTMASFTPTLSTVQSKLKIFEGTLSKQVEVLKAGIANIKDYNNSTTQMGPPIANAGKNLLGLNAKLALTTAGLVATKVATVALNTALSMGLSLVISGAISLITKLVDNMITTKAELKEMTDEFLANRKSTQEEIDTLEGLVSKHKQLQKELSNTELTEEQQRTKKEELIEVQKQLAELLPDTVTGYTDEGEAISQNTDEVQKNIDKKKELATQEALDLAEEFDEAKWVKLLNSYDEQKKKVEELQTAYDALAEGEKDPKLFAQLEEAKGKLGDLGEHITTASELMKAFKEEGFGDDTISDLFFKDFYDVYTDGQERQAKGFERLKEIIDDYTNSINNNTDAKNKNNEVQPVTEDSALEEIQTKLADAEMSTQSATNIMNAFTQAIENGVSPAEALASALNSIDMQSNLQEATKTYSECIEEVASLHDIMKELNEEQKLTPSIVSKVASAYPEVGASVTDLASLQDFLQNKINETMQKQSEAYAVMIGNDTQYYASKIANNSEFEQLLNDSINSIVGMQAEGYNIDLSHFSTLNELKNAIQNQFGEAQGISINGILDMYNQAYTFDSQNFADLQSMKQGYINQLIPAIANWIASDKNAPYVQKCA